MNPAEPAQPTAAAAASPVSARLLSLDAYRGFIMVCLAFGGFGLAGTARNHLKADPDSSFWKTIECLKRA